MNRNVPAQQIGRNGDVHAAVATDMGLLDAAYHTVHGYEGGAPSLAPRVGMNANTLQNKVNPNNETHHLTLVESRNVMAMTKDFRMLHALGRDLGHVCIAVDMDGDGITVEKVMSMTKEFGETLAAVGDATSKHGEAGHRVTRNEMARVEREAGELLNAINRLVSNIRAQAAEF